MYRQAGRRLLALIKADLQHLTTIQSSDRRWQLPLYAALASGLPLLVGAWFGHLDYGLISSLGGLVFLYTPNTPLGHRMVQLMASAFGMIACYTFGVLSHFFPPLIVLVLSGLAILVSMLCRYYRMNPPGSLFFIMAASIGAYTPVDILLVPLQVGLLTMGALLACMIAFFYSIHSLRYLPPQPVEPLPPASFDFVVFDSVVIGTFVGISLLLAHLLQLPRPYWVPVSCLAVIQGMNMRAVWTRQVHRMAGTVLGLLLAWALLQLPLNPWSVSLMMMLLSFVIETLIVRHYGLAVIFITPLTILLAEAVQLGHGSPEATVLARLIDTVLGCLVGIAGGACLHSPRFRAVVGGWMRRLIPERLVS